MLIVGHSEGAYHAARLAAEEKVAGTILLAAPAHTGEQIIEWQIGQIEPTIPGFAKLPGQRPLVPGVLRLGPGTGLRPDHGARARHHRRA